MPKGSGGGAIIIGGGVPKPSIAKTLPQRSTNQKVAAMQALDNKRK